VKQQRLHLSAVGGNARGGSGENRDGGISIPLKRKRWREAMRAALSVARRATYKTFSGICADGGKAIHLYMVGLSVTGACVAATKNGREAGDAWLRQRSVLCRET